MKTRIGVLTSGGDCPGLNAVLRGVVLAAEKLGWDVVGFRDGFEGLLPPGNHVILDRKSIDGIMALGGTIIGTTNRGHFVAKTGAGDRTVVPAHIIAGVKKILDELQVKALIIVGGDGSLFLDDPWHCREPVIELRRDGEPVDRMEIARSNPYQLEAENMSAAVRGDADPLLGRDDALGQARTIEALYEAADGGLVVPVSGSAASA